MYTIACFGVMFQMYFTVPNIDPGYTSGITFGKDECKVRLDSGMIRIDCEDPEYRVALPADKCTVTLATPKRSTKKGR